MRGIGGKQFFIFQTMVQVLNQLIGIIDKRLDFFGNFTRI